MKGWKSFLFFTSVALLGVVAMIEADDVQRILLPLVCHIDPASQFVADECVGRVVAITGAVMTGIGVAGKILRFVTTTPIFKP
jgi:hypothetical protein